MEIEFSDIEVDSPDGSFETANFYMDEGGACFMRSSLTVRIGDRDRILTLSARETSYVLKLMRIV